MANTNKIYIEKKNDGAIANNYIGIAPDDSEVSSLPDNKFVSNVPNRFYITKKSTIGDRPMADYIVDYKTVSSGKYRWYVRKGASGVMEQGACVYDNGNQGGYYHGFSYATQFKYNMAAALPTYPEPGIETPKAFLISARDTGDNCYQSGWSGWSQTSPGNTVMMSRPLGNNRGQGTLTLAFYYIGKGK